MRDNFISGEGLIYPKCSAIFIEVANASCRKGQLCLLDIGPRLSNTKTSKWVCTFRTSNGESDSEFERTSDMPESRRRNALGSLLCLALLSGMLAVAQGKPAAAAPADAESDEAKTAALAKAAQNPIADLISFPLQNNTAFGIGPYERAENELLIEPVIPLHITKDWNLITRTIWPQIVQPDTTEPTKGWTGFGDLNPSFFLSPSAPHKLTWGAGPTFVLPWATAEQLGQGKFSMGPAVVALTMPGHWVIGVLVNNIFSVEGPTNGRM